MTDQRDQEPIDFSALDPTGDQGRWQHAVDTVVARALAARRRRLTVAAQLVDWARPALVIAAGVALVAWAAAWASGGTTTGEPAQSGDPAFALAGWAATGELPPTPELVQILGGSHDRR